MDNSVLMILVDALSNYSISEKTTPFISSLAQKCYFEINPMFAYRGIEATIFTGVDPNTHKVWTEFLLKKNIDRHDRNRSLSKKVFEILDSLPNPYIQKIIKSIFINKPKDAMIPLHLIDYFEHSQPTITTPNALAVPTLFDLLRSEGKSFKFLTPSMVKGGDKKVFEKTISSLSKSKCDFIFVKFGMLDTLGHKYGPDSEKVYSYLKEIDEYAKAIYLKFKDGTSSKVFVLLSDHGMIKVEKCINVKRILKSLDLKVGRDYIYFLDSTMARFWFFNWTAQRKIFEKISTIKDGAFLETADLIRLGIDGVGPQYFREIFALKEGYAFYPDFFMVKPPKGMHGYAFEKSSKPVLIIDRDSMEVKCEKIIEFVDIFPTICHLMGMRIPSNCKGKSLII
jgi:hypothetical protein